MANKKSYFARCIIWITKKASESDKNVLQILCLALILIFLYADLASGASVDFSLFYFIPIVISAWFIGRRSGLSVSMASSAAWIYAEYSIAAPTAFFPVILINGFLVIAKFSILAYLIYWLKHESDAKSELEMERRQESAVLKTAQGVCGIIGEHVTKHNSAIINWVNESKNDGAKVPEGVEQSSYSIGRNMEALTRFAFVEFGKNGSYGDAEAFLEEFEKSLEG